MQFVNKTLNKKHKIWSDLLLKENPLFDECVIIDIDVLNAHFHIVDYFLENGGIEIDVEAIGPRDNRILSTSVAGQTIGYANNKEGRSDYEKCAALFYELVKNHPFHTLNNATALLTALNYLAKIDRAPTASHKELEVITRIIASNTIRDRRGFRQYAKFEHGEVRFLAKYLQGYTLPIDRKDYLITYMDLNNILNSFGFSIDHPCGNSIDIFRAEARSSLFSTLKSKFKPTIVGTIAFSGWTREVSKETLTLLKKCTGLTADVGFDSALVYKKEIPLLSLINKYKYVLHTLVNK